MDSEGPTLLPTLGMRQPAWRNQLRPIEATLPRYAPVEALIRGEDLCVPLEPFASFHWGHADPAGSIIRYMPSALGCYCSGM